MLLNLAVLREGEQPLVYSIPLHLSGIAPPYLSPLEVEPADINIQGTRFAHLLTSSKNFKVLPTTLYHSAYKILDVLGPVSDHAALILENNHVDFLLLKSRKIAGSIETPAGAKHFAGADGLYQYLPQTRTFSRLSVPDGRREGSIALPAGIVLKAVGVGTDSGSPVTLLCEGTFDHQQEQFGDVTVTSHRYQRAVLVLDGKTLQRGSWAVPIRQSDILKKSEAAVQSQVNSYLFTLPDDRIVTLPTSHSGRVVTMPNQFLVLGERFSTVCDYTNDSYLLLNRAGAQSCTVGSISGLIATSSDEKVFKGGFLLGQQAPEDCIYVTSCGRYKLIDIFRQGESSRRLEIRQTDNDLPLLQLSRLPILTGKAFGYTGFPKVLISLGDQGPIGFVNGSGYVLQLIDLDIPGATRDMRPNDIHLTSQPQFYVGESFSMEYKLSFNNPGQSRSYRLRENVPGATIDEQGVFRYTAPKKIDGPTTIKISIEVTSKSGQVVLHEFPIHVLALPGNHSPPKSPPKSNTTVKTEPESSHQLLALLNPRQFWHILQSAAKFELESLSSR